MKLRLTIISIFLSAHVLSQNKDTSLINEINTMVEKIDSATGKTETFRFIRGFYQYKITEGTKIKITYRYKAGIADIEKTFYHDEKEGLLFSKEKEVTYYLSDSIGWSGGFYFRNMKLKYYETLGHGKSETEDWDPEKEVLSDYSKTIELVRKNELSKKNKK